MKSREKVQKALGHEAGPVPIDCGSTPVSGMHCSCVAALRGHLGLEERPVKVHEPYQMLGLIESDLKEALGIDTDGIAPPGTIFGFANDTWKTWRTPWGQEVLVSEQFETSETAAGDTYIYPSGDRSVEPCAQMPAGGYFFDALIRQAPIDEEHLNPEDNLEEFGAITDEDLARISGPLGSRKGSERACVGLIPGTALGDIALVPAPFLKRPKGIRDVAEWYMSTVCRQDYVHAVFDKQVGIALGNLARIHGAVGEAFDVVMICGTDFGTQSSQFCSVETFRNLWKPYYQRITSWIHQNTKWKTFKHSCGSVECLLPDFIESGFDILNPVQCSAVNMDPQQLKTKYGKHIVFWGGGVDTQQILPFGRPEEVREQVLERCRIFAKDGGFVFNSIHNIQARTPTENILAMFQAVRDFNARG